ncbi:MAG TPA: hypothetical protein VGH70_12630 [Bradyrhizobium sp.]
MVEQSEPEIREANMKSVAKLVLGPAVFSLATFAFGGPVAAESVEQQCRAAVRAELMGPQCRIANPDYDDRCYYHYPAGMTNYVNKVIECINRGGPGHRARDAHR